MVMQANRIRMPVDACPRMCPPPAELTSIDSPCPWAHRVRGTPRVLTYRPALLFHKNFQRRDGRVGGGGCGQIPQCPAEHEQANDSTPQEDQARHRLAQQELSRPEQ